MSKPTPFTVAVPDERLRAIQTRVAEYPWHEMPEITEGTSRWAYGTDMRYLKALCDYWRSDYDWRAAETALNRFDHSCLDVTVEGETIPLHYMVEEGSGPNPRPLLLSHGWPGSVFEFLEVIEPLAHPERFGGDEKDAFTVVAPSLIGYGFSGKPKKPVGPRRIAAYFAELMKSLGYTDYVAQGGDWGSVISAYCGLDDPACAGVHLNMLGWQSPGIAPQTEEEKQAAEASKAVFEMEGAYFRLQSTKPQTLSYAMMDSPVGVAAWITEKFMTWSHTEGDDIESAYTKDQLLTNIMIYLTTDTFNTASWLYRGLFEDGFGTPLALGTRLEKPVGVAVFPFDTFAWPPRSQVERSYNIVHWSEIGEGGHFAALERPELFTADLRAFKRSVFG